MAAYSTNTWNSKKFFFQPLRHMALSSLLHVMSTLLQNDYDHIVTGCSFLAVEICIFPLEECLTYFIKERTNMQALCISP